MGRTHFGYSDGNPKMPSPGKRDILVWCSILVGSGSGSREQ